MVATATQILHQQDFEATKQVECTLGADNILRINIDGVCVLRVRAKEECEIILRDDEAQYEHTTKV
jgi:hypothetical protein